MDLKIYIQDPGADDGEPRDGNFVQCDTKEGLPLPEVGDEFFVAGMESPEIVERRLFQYKKNGDVHVILFVLGANPPPEETLTDEEAQMLREADRRSHESRDFPAGN